MSSSGLSRWTINPTTGALIRETQREIWDSQRSGERDCFLKNKCHHIFATLLKDFSYFEVRTLFSTLGLSITWEGLLCGFKHDGGPLWTCFFHCYRRMAMVPTSQGHYEGQGIVGHQRLDSSQATSGHRHIWFVPNNLLKFRICSQPSSTRRLHTKSQVCLRSQTPANRMSPWNNWLALPCSWPSMDASVPRILIPLIIPAGSPLHSFLSPNWLLWAAEFVTSVWGELFVNGLLISFLFRKREIPSQRSLSGECLQ